MSEFKDVIHTFSKYCSEKRNSPSGCHGCKMHYINTGKHIGCVDYLMKYPEEAEDFLNEWSTHIKCTMCGKELDAYDLQENFGFDYRIGYGSKHDLEHARAKFCCDCFDKILDSLIEKCVTSPIVGGI